MSSEIARPKVLILAGGLGTRLRTVVSDRPKPMAEAGQKPFLAHLVAQLAGQGFVDLVFCIGHLATQVQEYFGDGGRWGVHIAYAVETRLLGTAGAIRNAQDLLQGTFLVLNGDSYLDADFGLLVAAHRARRAADPQAIGTLAAVWMADAAAYGRLEIDAGGHLRRFGEKTGSGPGLINGGAYVLESEILDLIPAGRPVSIERETFPLVLERGQHLFAWPVEGFFVDIGTPEGYRRFCQHVEERGL